MQTSLLTRLDARDRALYTRWCIGPAASRRARLSWVLLTHLGGATCSVLAALLPLRLARGALHDAASRALATLVLSHLVVQAIKRTVGRPRPSRHAGAALIAEPDKFSFPSGHACAAMAVAFVYAMAFPAFAAPLLVVAVLVGISRTCLGVHYPGDVFVGQLIAIATGLLVQYA